MCKKYVNANLTCFKSILVKDAEPIAFQNPFDQITAKQIGEELYQLTEFKILSNINILGTADEKKKTEHVLYRKNGLLNFIIRLTKCDVKENKRFFYDLDEFSLDIEELRKSHRIDGACFDFVNYSRITNVPIFAVDKPGAYVIKLLVKENTEEEFTVQFLRKFIVKTEEK